MPTGPRTIETPTGPQVGNVFATMQVLGVSSSSRKPATNPTVSINGQRLWISRSQLAHRS